MVGMLQAALSLPAGSTLAELPQNIYNAWVQCRYDEQQGMQHKFQGHGIVRVMITNNACVFAELERAASRAQQEEMGTLEKASLVLFRSFFSALGAPHRGAIGLDWGFEGRSQGGCQLAHWEVGGELQSA